MYLESEVSDIPEEPSEESSTDSEKQARLPQTKQAGDNRAITEYFQPANSDDSPTKQRPKKARKRGKIFLRNLNLILLCSDDLRRRLNFVH